MGAPSQHYSLWSGGGRTYLNILGWYQDICVCKVWYKYLCIIPSNSLAFFGYQSIMCLWGSPFDTIASKTQRLLNQLVSCLAPTVISRKVLSIWKEKRTNWACSVFPPPPEEQQGFPDVTYWSSGKDSLNIFPFLAPASLSVLLLHF